MNQTNRERDSSFADLFSGLGGFHVGLSRLGMKCIFASELDAELRRIYKKNFNLVPSGDIRSINEADIPPHNVLCAGFPCQPFSKAGKRKGALCPESGKLIDDVLRIASYHLPDYVMLENVPSVLTIQNGEFWQYVTGSFEKLGYALDYKVYSPHDFGIPQKRKRVFIVASRVGLSHFQWPSISKGNLASLDSLSVNVPENIREIEPQKLFVLNKWQSYIENVQETTFHPILAAEFGATYPVEGLKGLRLKDVQKMKGAFGQSLEGCSTWSEVYSKLPHYINKKTGKASDWMAEPVAISRDTYSRNITFLDTWKKDLIDSHNSWQKFEWQGRKGDFDIWKHIIQFRASGIRIIKPECAPSLVAMTPTQTPILGSKRRYMSVREAASLQSLETLKEFPENNARAFKALGNAVNAFIVKSIAGNLIGKDLVTN